MSESEFRGRQVARRAFSREFNEATYTFKESDDDLAPVFALLPTGAAANRVFIVGTLTEADNIGDENEYWRARVVDPVGTFFVYAGQYQPGAMAMLRDTEPPAYLAITGKPRTYETDDGSVNVSLRPETTALVDSTTRRRWVIETAERTLDRLDRFDDPDNEYAVMAREHYDTSTEEYRDLVIEALESMDADAE